jgi:hypothetical protein
VVGKPVFIDSDTGASTTIDPRLRAFPAKGHDRGAGIRSVEYMVAYNANPSTCQEYWGHLGRKWITERRKTPTVFLFLCFCFVYVSLYIGLACIPFVYNVVTCKNGNCSGSETPRMGRMRTLMHTLQSTVQVFPAITYFYSCLSAVSLLTVFLNVSKGSHTDADSTMDTRP